MTTRNMLTPLLNIFIGLIILAGLLLPAPAMAALPDISPQLTAAVLDGPSVSLRWTLGGKEKISGYQVERSLDPLTGFSALLTTNHKTTAANDDGVKSGQGYYYRVRAYLSTNTTTYSQYSNVEFADVPAVVTVDTAPPSVTLVNPDSDVVITAEQTLSLAADAVDASGIERVDFYRNDILAGSSSTSPYTTGWAVSAAHNGQHALKAKAYDKAGNEAVSVTRTVTVDISQPAEAQPGAFQFSASAYSVDEGAGKIDVTIQRVGGSDGAASIDFRTRTFNGFGTADWATDFGTIDWTPISFANGQTSRVVSITIHDDNLVEGDEWFTIQLGNPTGGASLGSPSSAIVTIKDNDAATPQPGAFQFSASAYSVDEGAGKIDVTIQRVGGSDGAASIDFRTRTFNGYGDADWQTDYGTIDWTPISFADGQTSRVVSITIHDDNLVEGDEWFTIQLGNPTGGAILGSPVSATVTIKDNENASPGSLEFNSATYLTKESAGKVDIIINRVGGNAGPVSVDFRTRTFNGYGTADWSTDYGTIDWTPISFADGQTSRVVSITIYDDNLAEEDKWFTVQLQNPTGGAILGSIVEATVTIQDDDTEDGSTTPSSGDLGPVKVFPFAQGFGTDSPAGRGGQIIRVTNLNDSGTGSLRAALAVSGPRVVVFEVGGVINLASKLAISNPYITIAGQTAPDPGIMIKGGGIAVNTNDVLIQHLVIRPGDSAGAYDDCIEINNSKGYNVVLDHLSLQWAKDEQVSTWIGARNITVSNSILGEGLGEKHGMLIGDSVHNVSVLNSLFAHLGDRSPAIKGDTTALVANNVTYNPGGWEHSYLSDNGYTDSDGDGLSGPIKAAMVGNIYIDGNSSGKIYTGLGVAIVHKSSQVYQTNNMRSSGTVYSDSSKVTVSTSPINLTPFVIENDLSKVRANVFAYAGSRPAKRDTVDTRIISDVKNGTGTVPSSQPAYPNYPATSRAFAAPANPSGDDNGNGYTNLEEVLYQMSKAVGGK